ncbi:MAG: hypothetical protein J6D11_07830 [Clostridia bacterium]|nr:hypothetical protein [Clostridia bacterium]
MYLSFPFSQLSRLGKYNIIYLVVTAIILALCVTSLVFEYKKSRKENSDGTVEYQRSVKRMLLGIFTFLFGIWFNTRTKVPATFILSMIIITAGVIFCLWGFFQLIRFKEKIIHTTKKNALYRRSF